VRRREEGGTIPGRNLRPETARRCTQSAGAGGGALDAIARLGYGRPPRGPTGAARMHEIEIGRHPGVVQVTFRAPVERLERRGLLAYASEQYANGTG
jgi:hypothetical protein